MQYGSLGVNVRGLRCGLNLADWHEGLLVVYLARDLFSRESLIRLLLQLHEIIGFSTTLQLSSSSRADGFADEAYFLFFSSSVLEAMGLQSIKSKIRLVTKYVALGIVRYFSTKCYSSSAKCYDANLLVRKLVDVPVTGKETTWFKRNHSLFEYGLNMPWSSEQKCAQFENKWVPHP
nr:hypothetical protein HmN_000498200 [Hymenolepis microstoma]